MTFATTAFVSPMLVSRGPLPSGPGWAYEVKWDGIRGQVALLSGRVTVRSRPGRDCSASFSGRRSVAPELSQRQGERGFPHGLLEQLVVTPMSGVALVAGQLAGVLALGLINAVGYLLVGLAAGASLAAGLSGALVLLALATLITLAFGCIGVYAAFKLGNGEAVQGLFPVLVVFLFLSSMALPRPLIEQDLFRTIATYNPVSYLIEGIRSLFIDGFDAEALALAFGSAIAIASIFLALAVTTLRTRLVRT